MSKLEELIQQCCPDGVEYTPLSSIADLSRGKVISKDYIKDNGGDYPVYSSQSENEGILGRINSYMYDGKYLTWTTDGAYAGTVFRRVGKFNITNVCGLVKVSTPNVCLDFLYYWLQVEAPKYVYRGMGNPKLMSNVMAAISVPLPPLPVQEEIVRILDTFTELQAELQAELQKRKQQYNYYRDYLLSFEGRTDVEWKKLGEIASIKTGRRFVRTDTRESGVPCFHYGDIYTYYGLTATQTKGYLDEELAKKLRFAQPNDVVVVCAGENDMDIGVGVAWLGDEPAVVHDACCILHHNQSPRYISHFLRTHNYHLQMKKYVKNGKISSLPASGLAEALIPLPSFEEQERIAAILDRFDRLTNDLTSGLPAEIEKRRQQYEYYRDKLLTFKRKGA